METGSESWRRRGQASGQHSNSSVNTRNNTFWRSGVDTGNDQAGAEDRPDGHTSGNAASDNRQRGDDSRRRWREPHSWGRTPSAREPIDRTGGLSRGPGNQRNADRSAVRDWDADSWANSGAQPSKQKPFQEDRGSGQKGAQQDTRAITDRVRRLSLRQEGTLQPAVGPIVGTCLDMCPEKERRDRERFKDLAVFERVDGNRERTSVELAVKKFSRNAAERADEIRPLPVLSRTMDYLLGLLDDHRGRSLLTVHAFLWDRFRAIRQDLTLQHCFDPAAVQMHEQMARFHILSHYELGCQDESARARALPGEERFEPHMNLEQLSKTLAGLFQMYDDLYRKEGLEFRTEAEFRAYCILLQTKGRDGQVDACAVTHFLMRLRPSILRSPEVRFALRAFCCARAGDFVRFFRLARGASYLQACLLHGAFLQVRLSAFKVLNKAGMKGQAWSLAFLASVLATGGEVSTSDLCLDHGLKLAEDREGQPAVLLNLPGATVQRPETSVHRRANLVDESRRAKTLRTVVESH